MAILTYEEGRRLLTGAVWAVRTGDLARVPSGGVFDFPRGCFATLRCEGRLRGCLGRIEADEPLGPLAARLAMHAARADSRFAPLRAEEWAGARLALSILTPLLPSRAEEIEVGRHGVVLRAAGRSGVYLPEVGAELGLPVEGFLTHLARHKMGLAPDAWRDTAANLRRFETECHEGPLLLDEAPPEEKASGER